MRKRIVFISALLISLLVSTNALGQAFDPWVYENPERKSMPLRNFGPRRR